LVKYTSGSAPRVKSAVRASDTTPTISIGGAVRLPSQISTEML
jgi:hypothetical protein